VRWLRRDETPTITDARPSAEDDLRHRRRVYTVIMTVHILGFAVGGALYSRAWLAGLIIIIVTGPLQWIAVLLANAAPKIRHRPPPFSASRGISQRESRIPPGHAGVERAIEVADPLRCHREPPGKGGP